MFHTSFVLLALVATISFGSTAASGGDQLTSRAYQAAGTQSPAPGSTKDVLVTVNGIPIGEADVRLALSGRGHNKEVPSNHRENILEVIIQRELIHQRAVELGLDGNPRYQEKLRRMEAQINAFKRRELSELFWREIAGRVVIGDADAKEYFAENAARIRTELHVYQILQRKQGLIEQDLDELANGTSFEELAGKKFSKLPKAAGAPWDLGYLRWKQVPEAWRNVVYDLEKGEVSGVIRGPNNRFWIIKLIDKRVNLDITFESVKSIIVQVLKSAMTAALREKTERDLRANASVVYLKDPVVSVEE